MRPFDTSLVFIYYRFPSIVSKKCFLMHSFHFCRLFFFYCTCFMFQFYASCRRRANFSVLLFLSSYARTLCLSTLLVESFLFCLLIFISNGFVEQHIFRFSNSLLCTIFLPLQFHGTPFGLVFHISSIKPFFIQREEILKKNKKQI